MNLLKRGFLSFLLLFTLAPTVLAQDFIAPVFEPELNVEQFVEVGRNSIFDIRVEDDFRDQISVKWELGDGTELEGVEVVHQYNEPGEYVLNVEVRRGDQVEELSTVIFAYQKLMVFLADSSADVDRISGLIDYAKEQGVYLKLISTEESVSEFLAAEVLGKSISDEIDVFNEADQIIVWTKSNVGLTALTRFVQKESVEGVDLSNKTFLILSEDFSDYFQVKNSYSILKADKIIMAKEASVYPFIDKLKTDEFEDQLTKGGYEYRLIDESTGELKFWNFMSFFVNFLIDEGVPSNTVVLILLLPLIATLIAVMRQVVGLPTFGVYTPTLMTLTFYFLGFQFGLLTFAVVVIVGFLARMLLKRFRMMYVPRMSLVLTFVALSIFALLIFTIYFDLFEPEFVTFAIFPMLVMSTLAEKFVSIQTGKGFMTALKLLFQVLIVSLVAFFFVGGHFDLVFIDFEWSVLKNFILNYPEIIVLLILIDIFLGRWQGLRLKEYVRFRDLIRHIEE